MSSSNALSSGPGSGSSAGSRAGAREVPGPFYYVHDLTDSIARELLHALNFDHAASRAAVPAPPPPPAPALPPPARRPAALTSLPNDVLGRIYENLHDLRDVSNLSHVNRQMRAVYDQYQTNIVTNVMVRSPIYVNYLIVVRVLNGQVSEHVRFLTLAELHDMLINEVLAMVSPEGQVYEVMRI